MCVVHLLFGINVFDKFKYSKKEHTYIYNHNQQNLIYDLRSREILLRQGLGL